MNTNSNTPSFTLPVRGTTVTFVSAFATDADAALALAGTTSDFGRDLLAAHRSGRISERQRGWMHKLATEAAGPRRPAGTVPGLALRPVVQLLTLAAAAQKRAPRITLTLGEGRVVLTLCGPRSRYAGSVRITNGQPFGTSRDVYYGSIEPDGGAMPSTAWTPEVEALLHRLAANPAAVAAQHGVATGQCAFCGRLLSTKESRSVGYGPECAAKFGLPWGEVSAAVEAAAAAAQLPAAPRLTPEDVIQAEALAELGGRRGRGPRRDAGPVRRAGRRPPPVAPLVARPADRRQPGDGPVTAAPTFRVTGVVVHRWHGDYWCTVQLYVEQPRLLAQLEHHVVLRGLPCSRSSTRWALVLGPLASLDRVAEWVEPLRTDPPCRMFDCKHNPLPDGRRHAIGSTAHSIDCGPEFTFNLPFVDLLTPTLPFPPCN